MALLTPPMLLFPLWPAGRLLGSSRLWLVVGMAMVALATGLKRSAIVALDRLHRLDLGMASGHHIVDTGPYRRIRHPSYAATALMALGLGVGLASWASTAWMTLVFVGGLVLRIGTEERALNTLLGQSYGAYRIQTPWRLVPHLW